MSGRYKAYGEYKDSGVEWCNKLPLKWKGSNLRWLSYIYAGGTPSKNILDYWENGIVPWINSGAVNQGYVVTPSTYISKVAFENSSAKWIPKDSLVVALAGQGKTKGMVAQLRIDTTCNQSMAAIVFKKSIHSRYVFWWLRSNYQNIRNMSGGDLRDGLNLEILGDIQCPLPSDDECFKISIFLDHETAKIDTLIDKQQQLIELLIEKRQAVISHAVTKGLDPDVPMKDSGVEWLGEVPEHWVIQKIKWFATMKSGDFITSESIEIEDEFPVYGGNGLRGYSKRYTHDGKYVLIGRQGALCGNINYANGKFWASEHAVVVSPYGNNEVIWLGELFGFMNFNQYSFSAAQPGLAVERIKDLHIPIPPSSEQKLISRFLDFEIQLFESIKDKCNQSITLLQERRTALISAAVTGKIDVRDWQVPVTQTESDEVMA